jgi:tol-pal system-associated acyl-CoA thioesterase
MLEIWLPVRVYLEDTDAQGVVYNASYFRFMERARTEYLRAQSIDHDELRERHGAMLVLTEISARFRAPARLSDMLHVGASVSSVRGARMIFTQSVCRDAPDGEILCEGRAQVACMDTKHGKPKRFPHELVAGLDG